MKPKDWNRKITTGEYPFGMEPNSDCKLNGQQPTARKLTLPFTSLLNT